MTTRHLSSVEIREVRTVFGLSLDVHRVWVIEGAAWTNGLARLGAWLQREPPPRQDNAVGLGNRVYFPRPIRTTEPDQQTGFYDDLAWLIHELTHAWQCQHFGPRYIVEALFVQLTLGKRCYLYGGEQGLLEARSQGRAFGDFNREQQGDIARGYYLRLKKGQNASAWDPFIRDIQMT